MLLLLSTLQHFCFNAFPISVVVDLASRHTAEPDYIFFFKYNLNINLVLGRDSVRETYSKKKPFDAWPPGR